MKTKILILVMIIGIIVAGCGNNKKKFITAKEDVKQYPTVKGNPDITDFGNGVYYYKFIGCRISDVDAFNEFGPVISDFIALHKDLKVSALAANHLSGQYNGTHGYWIITEPITPCPCDTLKK